MGKIILGILDLNQTYAKRLSDYIVQNYPDKYSASYFSSLESLNRFLSTGLTLDILLASSEIELQGIDNNEINTVARLVEESWQEGEYENSINKYQPAEKILAEALNCIVNTGNRKYSFKNTSSRATKIVSFYSPVGGSGNTTLSIGAAINKATKGKKVLYLSFEDMESMSAYFNTKKEDNLSELLYFIKEGKENIKLKMDIVKNKDEKSGIEFISPFSSCIDKMDITPEDMQNLMNSLRELQEYDYIFIDTDNIISKETVAMIKETDRLIISMNDDHISKIKAENMALEFARIGNLFNIRDLDEKIMLIINKHRNGYMDRFLMNINDKKIGIGGFVKFLGNASYKEGEKLRINQDIIRSFDSINID